MGQQRANLREKIAASLVVVSTLLVWLAPAECQPPLISPILSPTRPTDTEPPLASSVGSQAMEVYYLEDAKGKLVPVPGLKLEDFTRLFRSEQGIKNADVAPDYVLRDTTMSGSIQADRVRLELKMEFQLASQGVIRIPLALNEALLEGEEIVEGCSTHLLTFNDKGLGYCLWLKDPESSVRLSLPISVPVDSTSEGSEFKLTVPPGLRSVCTLDLPVQDPVVSTNDTAQLQAVAGTSENSTRVTCSSLASEFSLAWQQRGAASLIDAPLFEARGEMQIDTLDPSTIRSSISFEVTAYSSRRIPTFRIRLPKKARLIECADSNDYTWSTQVDSEQPEELFLEIRPRRRVTHRLNPRFVLEQSADSTSPDSELMIGDLEILGAIRHSGRISLANGGNCQLRWREGDSVRRVSPRPNQSDDLEHVADFEYFRQPVQLALRIGSRTTATLVQPRLIFDVQPTSVELRGILKCWFRGAPASTLDIESRGWSLVRVESTQVSNQDLLEPDKEGVVRISFQRPLVGPHEIGFRAVRALETIPGQISFPLPTIRGATMAPAEIVIVSAENLTLAPVRERMKAFLPDAAPADLERALRDRLPLYYVHRAENQQDDIVMDVDRRARIVTARGNVRCEIQQSTILVTQSWDFDIRNEFLEQIRLRGPASVERLAWLLNDQPLDARLASSQGYERAAWLVQLPRPRQGQFRLSAKFRVPIVSKVATATAPHIPLFIPMDGTLEGIDIEAASVDSWDVRVATESWHIDHPQRMSEWTRIGTISDAAIATEIPLQLTPQGGASAAVLAVQNARYRIWLSKSRRQDQLHWQMISRQRTVTLHIPSSLATESLRVRVAGNPTLVRRIDETHCDFDLPSRRDKSLLEIELLADYPRRPRPGNQLLELIHFEGLAWTERWQYILSLSKGEYLLDSSAEVLDPASLEQDRVRVNNPANPLPSVTPSEIHYLTEIGNLPTLTIRTATTAWLWCKFAWPGLLAGWLVCYVPFVRHPYMAIVAALGLIAWGMLQPFSQFIPMLFLAGGIGLGALSCWLRNRYERVPAGARISTIREGSDYRSSARSEPTGFQRSPAESIPIAPPESA